MEDGTDMGHSMAAARSVVGHLAAAHPLGAWLVTAIDGEHQHIKAAASPAFALRDGDSFPYRDSLCARMIAGNGPPVASAVASIPAYADAPIVRRLGIRAYVGAPIVARDGQLRGTVCGLDGSPRPGLDEVLPNVQLAADLLGELLDARLELAAERARAETAERDATGDTLTGRANRRAWDRMLDAEEARCARHGAAACVISVDLDGLKTINDTAGHLAGDAALRLAADAIASASRDEDVVARVGGDEFGILAIECERSAGDVIAARVVRSLREAGLSASLGVGSREPVRGLFGAWLAADAAMYRDKARR